MIKKILGIIVLVELAICIFCFFSLPNKIKQPKTFYQLDSYQLAKYSIGTNGRICYQYANRMKKLYPNVKKEHVIIRYRGYDTLTHYRVILFESERFTIYTDSNAKGKGIIRTWYDLN